MRSVLVTVKDFDIRYPKAAEYLKQHQVELIMRDSAVSLTPEERETILSCTPALFVGTELCDAALLSQARSLKILSRMGSGMDNIDLDWCRTHGVAVSNSRGCNANGVAEMTLLLILASLRGLNRLYGIARKGAWDRRFPGEELQGKTVGLVGFGTIARKLAALLAPFSVRILACDPYMDEAAAQALHVEAVDMETLLTSSDVVSVHIPALPENRELFCAETFAKMKQGAVFVNCSRGVLVNEDDLYEALSGGKLGAAATDVWYHEPVSPGHKLFTLDNFIGTPHGAGMTKQSWVDDSMTVVRSIVACLDGEEIPYRVV